MATLCSPAVSNSKNSVPQHGIQDISVALVPIRDVPSPSGDPPAPAASGSSIRLIAVSTRATRVELLACLPHAVAEPASCDHATEHGFGETGSPAEPQNGAAVTVAPQEMQTAAPGGAAQLISRPRLLKTLQVPRGSSSAASQAMWAPVCWLSAAAAAAAAQVSAAGRDSSGPRALCAAWLLVGLPSGGVMLWKVSVDGGCLSECAVAVCVGQGPQNGPRPPHRSPRKPATDGAWRPRSAAEAESPDSGISWRSKGVGGPGEAGLSVGPTQAATVEQCKVQMPDVHARMLFTLHAFCGSGAADTRSWRVLSTSYDRKIVSWLLLLDKAQMTAKVQPQMTWHGTGSQVSAICSVSVCSDRHPSCLGGARSPATCALACRC